MRIAIAAAVACLSIVGVTATAQVHAAIRKHTEIPPEPLDLALRTLAKDRGFQLVYLTFTAPRADPVAFRVLTDQLKVMLANRQAQPDTLFNEALDAALSQNHLRAQPLTPARLNQMNLEKSLAFYKDRFADASDFIFVFVGSFDLATMKPLVERYLGSLPALNRNEAPRDVGMHPPAGIVEKQVKSGIAGFSSGKTAIRQRRCWLFSASRGSSLSNLSGTTTFAAGTGWRIGDGSESGHARRQVQP